MAGRMGFCVWGLFWTPLSISPWVSQLRICCCGCHWTLWTTDWGFWGKGQSWRLLDAAAAVHIYSVCRTPFPVFMYISVHKSTLTKRGDMCIVEWNQLSNLVSTFPPYHPHPHPHHRITTIIRCPSRCVEQLTLMGRSSSQVPGGVQLGKVPIT